MNVILILLDSLNRHYLPCYGNDWVKAPNITKVAERGTVFDNHFIGSSPCMPARREIFTGRREFLWRGWGPPEPFDVHLVDELKKAGVYTAMITDHYHYWDQMNGYGYTQPFDFLDMIRGHEYDSWGRMLNENETLPVWVQAIAKYRGLEDAKRYYQNVADFKEEEDFYVARVMNSAARWLEQNGEKSRFFLVIESFDPHEPWYVPEPYRSMYGPYREDFTCWPPYQKAEQVKRFFEEASEEELEFIRHQYAGNITMVDHHLGKVLDVLDRKGLWNNTIVILTTDHGHEMGERHCYGKFYPHWNTHANIPLIIWDPRYPGRGRRVKGFSCTSDIYATVLDAFGVAHQNTSHSRSLLPAVADPSAKLREAVLYGTFAQGACVVNDRYTYFSGYDNRYPVFWYSTQLPSKVVVKGDFLNRVAAGRFMSDVETMLWRFRVDWYLVDAEIRRPEQLFRYDEDYEQKLDIVKSDAKGRKECRELMIELMRELGAPPEQFVRLGLVEQP